MNDIPLIFDRTDGQDLRINMIGSWLKRNFGRKIVKLSIDGGELHVDGRVESLSYEDAGLARGGGLLSRLFGG